MVRGNKVNTWLLASPGHQQAWYWLCLLWGIISITRLIFHEELFQLPASSSTRSYFSYPPHLPRGIISVTRLIFHEELFQLPASSSTRNYFSYPPHFIVEKWFRIEKHVWIFMFPLRHAAYRRLRPLRLAPNNLGVKRAADILLLCS